MEKRFLGFPGQAATRLLLVGWLLLGLLGVGDAWASPYLVEGVTVQVTPAEAKGKDPRMVGVEKSKGLAMERLLRRLLGRTERERHAARLDKWLEEAPQVVEGVVVRSEKRAANDELTLVVDVRFNGPAVQRLLSKSGMVYNEAPMPTPLVMVATREGSEPRLAGGDHPLAAGVLEVAKEYALPVVTPLGDMDDMVNLPWEQISVGDPVAMQWAAGRYGVGQVWLVSLEVAPVGKEKAGAVAYQAKGSLRVVRVGAPAKVFEAKAKETHPNLEAARAALTTAIARQWLQQVQDGWAQARAVSPELGHLVRLRLEHGLDLPRTAELMRQLRQVAGLNHLQWVQLEAGRAALQADYQGENERLAAALRELGLQVEAAGDGLAIRFAR